MANVNTLDTKNLTQKKLETYLKYCEVIKWGRSNPVKFAELMFGMEMMDYQKYIFMESWAKPFVLWLMTRNGGKSVLSAPFIMSKLMLFPNFNSYILSLTASQSQDTFMKMEKIAKKQIESFVGLTDVFSNEILTTPTNQDGFVHSPSGFRYALWNGSQVTTVSGSEDNIRGE